MTPPPPITLQTRAPTLLETTEIQKAAYDHGWRAAERMEGHWRRFLSTTAPGEIAVAPLVGDGRPYALRAPLESVAAAMAEEGLPVIAVAGVPAFYAERAGALHGLVSRAYRLAMALPANPVALYHADLAKAGLTTEALGATETERRVKQRLGQDRFRAALLDYWDGRCPLTGITDPALLRASHIIPWAECDSDAERLDVFNGLLLSALWDAAFDAHRVSFAEDGRALAAPGLDRATQAALGLDHARLEGLRAGHLMRLRRHRARAGCNAR